MSKCVSDRPHAVNTNVRAPSCIAAGDAISLRAAQILHLSADVSAAGDERVKPGGEIGARGQVLAAAGHEPSTVADIARAWGLTRLAGFNNARGFFSLVKCTSARLAIATKHYVARSRLARNLLAMFAVVAGMPCTVVLHAQSTIPIVRTIVDTTNETIAHAVVTIHATDAAKTLLQRTLTGPNGRLSGISLAPGTYWMIVRRIGFKPDTQSLKISAGTTAAYTMVVASIPVALPPILVAATQCTDFGALARDSVLSHAWDLLETTIMSRAALYQNYEYEVASVDSSYAPERTPQWNVKSKTVHGKPTESRSILTFNEPLYMVTFRGNKPNLKTGTEFGLLSNAFKANHCITLASDEGNADIDVLRFESLPRDARNFRVEGRVVINRATSGLSQFSYAIFRNDACVARAYFTYGTTNVLGKAFPVITQSGLELIDPSNGQTTSSATTSSTYGAFKRVNDRP